MTTVNYPSPVTVNGYSCKNCTDVDYAKKNIDPAHPTDGPYGINAKAKLPAAASPAPVGDSPIVTFAGVLAGLIAAAKADPRPTATQGLRLDISA